MCTIKVDVPCSTGNDVCGWEPPSITLRTVEYERFYAALPEEPDVKQLHGYLKGTKLKYTIVINAGYFLQHLQVY